ncbi:hypothetical protein GH741_12750 [Aquibacillus halophilus]|uniref:Dipeptidylpeptidase IV N-terminal domain-containing protein n=1 Tax=Aquibacillus halophilus TaxID=930132 RepID=A0A6A8DIC9_9BACI|nr:hypothetical protein [Aquibacillus halophilus]MRH43549.1 hypothetical protein [Aquibacillus halophilus]
MSKRKVYYSIIGIGCLFLFVLAIYNEKNSKDEIVAKQDSDALQLIEENSTRNAIQILLQENKRALSDWWAWSPNKQMVAFTYLEKGSNPVMYLWKVGDTKPTRFNEVTGLEEHPGEYYFWSPNSKYFITETVDSGIKKKGYVYSVEKQKMIDTIPYVISLIWSPDSRRVGIGIENTEFEPMIATELYGTVDLGIYNIETGKVSIVEGGTGEYYLIPSDWDEDGYIHAEKRYINSSRVNTNLKLKVD